MMKKKMKNKALTILLSLSMTLTMIPMMTGTVHAATQITVDGIKYDLNKNNTAVVASNQNIDITGEVAIPSIITFNEVEYTVTSIDKSAFYECRSLKSIDIPSSVTSISKLTFYGCRSLKSVTIPSSITSIGDSAFYNCNSLENIVIPSSVTSIGEYAFYGCSLKSIDIPSSVTSIGNGALYSCYSLNSIDIPSSVTSIGKLTFYGCRSLKSVTIPSSVTSIGDSAFCDCKSLENIDIPSSVTSIGDNAFHRCISLKHINIHDGVTTIGSSAFRSCNSLESIVFPMSYNYMRKNTLRDCSNLKSIYLYNVRCDTTFTNYGGNSLLPDYYPIYGWDGPLKIFMSASESPSLATLARWLVRNNDKPILDIIPCSSKAFYDYCSSLEDDATTVAIPPNLGEINIDAFKDFSKLESMSIDMTGNTIVANNSGNSIANLKALHIKVSEECCLNLSSNLLNRLERLLVSSSEESFREAYPDQYELVKDKTVFGIEEITDITDIRTAVFDTIGPIRYNGADNPMVFPPLMCNDKQLELGKDYELTYSVDYNSHKLNLVVVGQGLYYGTKEFSVDYNRPDASEVTVSNIPDQSYTGRRITPNIVVCLNDNVLSMGKDYTLSFNNNTKVGEATAVIELSNVFTGNRTITKSFSIIDNTELNSGDTGYALVVNAGKRTLSRHLEGQKVTIFDMNEVPYKTFQRWEVVSGDLSIPESQANNRTLSITMPATDVTIQAVYSGQSLQDEITVENNRYNAIVVRASTLDAYIKLYSSTANRIKSKYGISYLQSSIYYNSQAISTQTDINKKQNRLAMLMTSGGNQVEIKQLEAEIKELQSDYKMYIELKSAAQDQEYVDAAQDERNSINLITEKKIHENNISSICKKHGVKEPSVKEIAIIRLDKDEYAYSGKAIKPTVTVIDSDGKNLGSESFDLVYPSDCISEGEHIITLKLKGNYVGQIAKSFYIVKHKYGDWVIKTKPTCTQNGERKRICSECGRVEVEVMPAAHNYGEWKTIKAATYTSAGIKEHICSVCGKKEHVSITIIKMDNPLKIKAKTAIVKGSTKGKKGKLKKTKTLGVTKVITFTKKGQGKLSYKKISGNKKITIKKTTGKVTVKKGLKKGTYKVKVKVKAAGNANYKASSWKTITFKVKVK